MTWQGVASLLEKEEIEMKNRNGKSGRTRSSPVPLTPVHSQQEDAAAILSERGPKVTKSQQAYEIKSYATRNSLAHNGVRRMVENRD